MTGSIPCGQGQVQLPKLAAGCSTVREAEWRVRHWQPNKIEFKEKVHYVSIRRKVELKNVLSKSRVKSDKSPWPPLSIKWFAIGVFSSILPPPCTAQRMLLFTLYFLRSSQFWLLLTKSLKPFTVSQELELTLEHMFLTRNFLNGQETLAFCFLFLFLVLLPPPQPYST